MEINKKIVTSFNIEELWNENEVISARQIRDLDYEEIVELLKTSKISFVIADIGMPIKWIPIQENYDFWKKELKNRVTDPEKAKKGFRLEDYPGEYCYLVSEWKDNLRNTFLLLKKYH